MRFKQEIASSPGLAKEPARLILPIYRQDGSSTSPAALAIAPIPIRPETVPQVWNSADQLAVEPPTGVMPQPFPYKSGRFWRRMVVLATQQNPGWSRVDPRPVMLESTRRDLSPCLLSPRQAALPDVPSAVDEQQTPTSWLATIYPVAPCASCLKGSLNPQLATAFAVHRKAASWRIC